MQTAHFIHQAGVYPRDPMLNQGTFYSPMFASEWDEADRSYSVLVWVIEDLTTATNQAFPPGSKPDPPVSSIMISALFILQPI